MGDVTEALCSVVGTAVLVLATVMKVPQIYSVVKAGTSQGLSLNSLLMECWCFSIVLVYPIANGYPLSAYIDMVSLNIQDLILLILVTKEKNLINITTCSAFVGYVSLLIGAAKLWIPSVVLFVMSSSVPVIGISGRVLQIVSILRSKDAGAVSPLSWAIASIAAAGKVFIHCMLTGDKYLIFLSGQACFFSAGVCISALMYPAKIKKQ